MSRRMVIMGVATGAVLAYAWYRRFPVEARSLSREGGREPAPASGPAYAPLPLPPPIEAPVEAQGGEEAAGPLAAEEDPAPAPVGVVDVSEARDTGEPLEWLLSVPSSRKRRRRRRALSGLLGRSRPLAALAGVVLLLNLAVVGVLATTSTFDAVGNWFSSWLSLLF